MSEQPAVPRARPAIGLILCLMLAACGTGVSTPLPPLEAKPPGTLTKEQRAAVMADMDKRRAEHRAKAEAEIAKSAKP